MSQQLKFGSEARSSIRGLSILWESVIVVQTKTFKFKSGTWVSEVVVRIGRFRSAQGGRVVWDPMWRFFRKGISFIRRFSSRVKEIFLATLEAATPTAIVLKDKLCAETIVGSIVNNKQYQLNQQNEARSSMTLVYQ